MFRSATRLNCLPGAGDREQMAEFAMRPRVDRNDRAFWIVAGEHVLTQKHVVVGSKHRQPGWIFERRRLVLGRVRRCTSVVLVKGSRGMRLERVEPGHVLAWRSEDGNWVWTFVLQAHDGTTRLISRNRFRLPTIVARIGMLPMEPGSLLMERKMLLGIKERAERLA